MRPSATGAAAANARADSRVKTVLYVLAAVLSVVVFVVPLAWALLRSLQPNAVITAAPDGSTFFDLTTANFRAISDIGSIPRAIGNSLVVSVGTAVLTALLATTAGYGFGRFRFAGSGVAFALILVTLMIPFQAILTPLFLELNAMRLTDNLLGLVLFYSTVNLPFGVFVMRTAFASVPNELEDAANVDGAGTVRTLISVLRPSSCRGSRQPRSTPSSRPGRSSSERWCSSPGRSSTRCRSRCSTCSRARTAPSTTACWRPGRSSP